MTALIILFATYSCTRLGWAIRTATDSCTSDNAPNQSRSSDATSSGVFTCGPRSVSSMLAGGGNASKVSLWSVSPEEKILLSKLLNLQQKGSLGVGIDVKDTRRKYNSVQYAAAWRVGNDSQVLAAYKTRVAQLNQEKRDVHYNVETLQNGVNMAAREAGLLGNNEYWMMHGTKAENIESILCDGMHADRGGFDGAFGRGVYLADAIDKTDQYSSPLTDISLLSRMVGNEDVHAQFESLKDLMGEGDDLAFVLVVRAYLGQHLQLMIEDETTEDNQKVEFGPEGKKRPWTVWHWKDATSGESTSVRTVKKNIYEGETSPGNIPPFPRPNYDSVKVMCQNYNPDYSQSWFKAWTTPEGAKRSNAFPFRFNEYVVPYSDRTLPQLAPAYVIAYKRQFLSESRALPKSSEVLHNISRLIGQP